MPSVLKIAMELKKALPAFSKKLTVLLRFLFVVCLLLVL